MIHPTAIIDELAIISKGVKIGPFSIIGPQVLLEENVEIKSHVVIEGDTIIGKNTVIYPFSSIGQPPQILKPVGNNSKVIIGDFNTIREYVTIQAGSESAGGITSIGNRCLFMVGAHVGHDCKIGNNVILANYSSIGGHVEIGDYSIIGGLAGVHQYVRIGAHAMVGGVSAVVRDVIPFGLASNDRANLEGINLTGIKRRGFDREEALDAVKAIKEIFDNEGVLVDRIKTVAQKYKNNSIVAQIIQFLVQDSSRAFCGIKK
ncbi:MAG: acyl-ACP--UDP-N-acetylglucosamine O-acyltransferase [Rickettsiaceae bacterium]|nr:MAG: acyl-ACP--UDP-N-acetylglucosamine O-acyltransferase [Rickettsiaceae bacterium]